MTNLTGFDNLCSICGISQILNTNNQNDIVIFLIKLKCFSDATLHVYMMTLNFYLCPPKTAGPPVEITYVSKKFVVNSVVYYYCVYYDLLWNRRTWKFRKVSCLACLTIDYTPATDWIVILQFVHMYAIKTHIFSIEWKILALESRDISGTETN